MLWHQLRARQLAGAKFRRQVPLKGYILDFVCFEEMIIIEVDGSQHAENRRDEVRDAVFREDGFRVVRFWNEDVEPGLDFVCKSIVAIIRDRGE